MNESKGSSTLKILKAIPKTALVGSLFSTGLILTYGYASQLIYTIGDTRQLDPLLLGIIIGAFLYSLIGYVIKSALYTLVAGLSISAILLAIAYGFMLINSFAIGSTGLLLVGLMLTSIFLPVSVSMRIGTARYSIVSKIVFGIIQASLSILFIVLYAFYYEITRQVNLFLGPLIFLLLSAIAFSILSFKRHDMPSFSHS